MTTWKDIKEQHKDLLMRLEEFAYEEKALPEWDKVFYALDLCPFENVKIVILGESPYSNGQANGLAFSGTTKVPPSLNIVYRELERTHKIINTKSDLSSWAKQGILLLNSVLTVKPGEPHSHKHVGWEQFVGSCLMQLCDEVNPIFVAWGSYAKTFYKACGIKAKTARVLYSAHPSPLARGQFIGNNHFTLIDKELERRGESIINWRIK